jgi:hypothetical protein
MLIADLQLLYQRENENCCRLQELILGKKRQGEDFSLEYEEYLESRKMRKTYLEEQSQIYER